ncbi:hypothetical protein [Thermococcus sp.]|uniref:hypothetical protein n=1 Tax=Thermococcus sp. TaxID=35749 RepID=UPI0026188A0F|nr:hypothetical protein [Thermococcus sp.]
MRKTTEHNMLKKERKKRSRRLRAHKWEFQSIKVSFGRDELNFHNSAQVVIE